MNTPDDRRPRLPTDVVHAPAAAAFTPPAAAGRIVGEFIWYIGDTGLEGLTPGPWLSCHGQQELVADYPEPADVVGLVWEAPFGAAAAATFRLPDVRGRAAPCPGAPSSPRTLRRAAAPAPPAACAAAVPLPALRPHPACCAAAGSSPVCRDKRRWSATLPRSHARARVTRQSDISLCTHS